MAFQTEAELLAALKDSEFWKYVQNYLQTRREALLLSDDVQSTEKLWQDRGAIREITRLFNLPHLIMAKLTLDAQARMQAQAEAMRMDREADDFDG